MFKRYRDKTVCKQSEEHYHLWNICLPSNVASKAACYLDCISLRDVSALIQHWITSANKLLLRLNVCTPWSSVSLWQNECLSGCLNNQMQTAHNKTPWSEDCIGAFKTASYYCWPRFLWGRRCAHSGLSILSLEQQTLCLSPLLRSLKVLVWDKLSWICCFLQGLSHRVSPAFSLPGTDI